MMVWSSSEGGISFGRHRFVSGKVVTLTLFASTKCEYPVRIRRFEAA